MTSRDEKVLCLFDVDGTLTYSRQKITSVMAEVMQRLRQTVVIGLVGGSDLAKIHEQMSVCGDVAPMSLNRFLDSFDYVFAENGLVAYRRGELLGIQNLVKYLGEETCQRFINFCLGYMSKVVLPFKRGNFIEFRNGMINVTPCGRSVSQAERLTFAEYDVQHGIRKNFVEALRAEFPPESGLRFSIGGQISIDVFPEGWDKTYCLKWIPESFEKIYFFGDRTKPGENDYEIYSHERVQGHHVNNPEETKKLLNDLFGI